MVEIYCIYESIFYLILYDLEIDQSICVVLACLHAIVGGSVLTSSADSNEVDSGFSKSAYLDFIYNPCSLSFLVLRAGPYARLHNS